MYQPQARSARIPKETLNKMRAERDRQELAAMKPFDRMLKDGDLVGIERAAELTGYDPAHLRLLCRTKKVAHMRRGRGPRKQGQYYFTKEQIERLRPQEVSPKDKSH